MAEALLRTKHPRGLTSLIEGLQSSLSNQLLTPPPGLFTTGCRRTAATKSGAVKAPAAPGMP